MKIEIDIEKDIISSEVFKIKLEKIVQDAIVKKVHDIINDDNMVKPMVNQLIKEKVSDKEDDISNEIDKEFISFMSSAPIKRMVDSGVRDMFNKMFYEIKEKM